MKCHGIWRLAADTQLAREVPPESSPDEQGRPARKKPRQVQTPQDDMGNIITRAFAGSLKAISKGPNARQHVPKQAAAGCCTNDDRFTHHHDQHEIDDSSDDDEFFEAEAEQGYDDDGDMSAGIQSLEDLDHQWFEQAYADIDGKRNTS